MKLFRQLYRKLCNRARRKARLVRVVKQHAQRMDALAKWRVVNPPARTRIDLTMAHVRTETRERKRGRWIARLLEGHPAFKMRLPPKREDAA